MTGISARKEQQLKKLVRIWPEAASLSDACFRAGFKTPDPRGQHRIRRQAEEFLGVELPAINGKQSSSFWDIDCPSSLDIASAKKKKDFVITSHTNDSPLVKPFLKAQELFMESKNGQLLVIPVRYRNPDAFHKEDQGSWSQEIHPFVLTDDFHVSKDLVISSHRLNATRVNPLSGNHALTGRKSVVYGHPQLAMEMVGSPKKLLPKVMMTTGSCNKARYSATNAGGTAKEYHTLSAIYIKVVRGGFHYIQLTWDGTGFCYGNEYWTEGGMQAVPEAPAIVHGDSHVYHEIAKVTNSKLRVNSLLKPFAQVWHDLHDQGIGGHHETLRERIERTLKKEIFIEDEVRLAPNYLERLGADTLNYIVGANHNDHLDIWHASFDPRKDPANAKFHGWLAGVMYGTEQSALEACFNEWGCGAHYEFLDRSAPRDIYGILIQNHGDKGTNGSRGSPKGFAKTAYPVFIGHSHTPRIEKSCWQVGTSTDEMTYAQGDSTWMLTDGIIYFNGTRALINHIRGKTIFDFD